MARPLHVLIVEDRLDDADLMVHTLRRAGFDPDWERVETEEAYLKALSSHPDVILADYSLPQLDGLRALQLLQERNLDIPFILVSGAIGEDAAAACIRAGAADYLLKDRLARLGTAVGQALERKQLRTEKRAIEERFRALVQHSSDIITILEPDGTIRYESPSIEKILGYTPDELVGENAFNYVHPDDRKRVLEKYEELVRHRGATLSLEYRFRHKNGTWCHLESTGTNLLDEPAVAGIGVNSRDISERVQVNQALEESNRQLKKLVEELARRNREINLLNKMSDNLQVCDDLQEAYIIIARFAQKLFPAGCGAIYARPDGSDMLEMQTRWDTSSDCAVEVSPKHCRAVSSRELVLISSEGAPECCRHLPDASPEQSLCIPLLTPAGVVGFLYVRGLGASASTDRPHGESLRNLADALTDQIALALSNLFLRQRLREQAIRDPLTDLYNRRYMQEALHRELQQASRAETPLAVVMIDLDHFKDFNDTFGHAAGDVVLRELGEFLRTHVRGGDVACRYGGEEFVLILPGASPQSAYQRANQLRKEFGERAIQHEGKILDSISLSLGIACYPHHGETAHELLSGSDEALYRAKAEGRDRTRVLSLSLLE